MKEYQVSLTCTITMTGTTTVEASNDDAAQKKVDKMLERGAFGTPRVEWQPAEKGDTASADWDMDDHSIEVESVDES